MAHFAELDENNTVINVIVVNNSELLIDGIEVEQKGIQFCKDLLGGNWIQTSYNHNIRKQYAGIGYIYDADADIFISPKPFPSWSLDENYDWQAPVEKPEGAFYWDEESLSWLPIPDVG